MILTESVEVKITTRNIDYFFNFGYTYVYLGCLIDIPVVLMQKGSQQEIECKCDSCGIEKTVIYKNYIKYLGEQEWGTYYCRKCSEHKRKQSLLMNYGVEYPYQNKKLRSKNR